MKFTKFLKVFAKSAIALTFAAFAFSCANIGSNASVSSSDANTRTVNLKVTNYDDLVETSKNIVAKRAATSGSARTIIADSFDLSGIKLFLYGTSAAGTTYGPKEVTAIYDESKKTVGKIAIPAESNNWEFTLYAIASDDTTDYTDTNDLLANAVLVGYSSMDMANGDTATFTLSPDGLTKTSVINLSLTLDNWDLPSGFTSTAGIYLLTTGADATTSGDGEGTATEKTSLTLNKTSATPYEVSSMTPGTYLFKVTFANSTTGKSFSWSDVIIVLPGKKLDTSIAIPNVIGTIPDNVTDFKAGYITNSEDKYPGYYTVAFEWARPTSKNENYYEIDVVELSLTDGNVTLPNNSTWSSSGTSTTYAGISDSYASKLNTANSTSIVAFSSSDVREDGSLLGGNKAAQFRLELGKRYYARIRAVNDAGTSAEYTYVDLTESPTAGGTIFASNTINRYRITYYANGGNYYTSTSSISDITSLVANSDNIVEYFCQDATDGNAVIQGNGTTEYGSNYYLYKYGNSTWSYWNYYDNGTAKKYEDTENKGYANLDLYAVYTGDASVEIDDKSAYKILNNWITITATDISNVTVRTLSESGTGATITIIIDKDNATSQEVKWMFNPVEDSNKITDDFTFDKVNFTVSKGGVTYTSQETTNVGTTGKDFTQDLSKLSSGVYNVLFTAHTGTTVVSYPITLTIAK